MRKPCISLILLLSIVGCSKHDDAPVAQASSGTPANPPSVANPCDRGGTIVVNKNGGFSSGSTLSIAVQNFMPSCGDTVNVFISNPGQNAWFPVVQAPTAQPNWYTVGVGSVTIHNGSAVQQDWELSATEK